VFKKRVYVQLKPDNAQLSLFPKIIDYATFTLMIQSKMINTLC
jgi:hypothetical protein